MPSSISGVFEHTSGVKRIIPPHFLACSLFMRKESKFQMIRRITFAAVSKNSFLHTHLQICVVECGYRIVFPVLCLCLIVETTYLNTYLLCFGASQCALHQSNKVEFGVWGSLSTTSYLFITDARRRSWRNPVYLSSRCGLLREKKTLDYNGARFYVQSYLTSSTYNGDSRS